MTDRVERRLSRVWPRLAVGALALLLAGPLGAQDREDRSCRCVDRDGKEIENCHCLRTVEPRAFPEIAGGFTMERRSQIGVWIDYQRESDGDGVRIGQVQEGGPADEAGMRTGDLVVSVDGHSVLEPLDDEAAEEDLDGSQPLPVQRFISMVGALKPDEPADIEVIRDGGRRTLQVTPEAAGGIAFFGLRSPEGGGLLLESPEWRLNLDELRGRSRDMLERLGEGRQGIYRFETPGHSGEVHFFTDSLPRSERSFFGTIGQDPCAQLRDGDRRVWVLGGDGCVDGAELVELNPELGEYFGTDKGVLVTRVAEDSPLGLRAGDVLLAIGGRAVSDVEDVRRILASYTADEDIRLRVRRKGSEQEVLGRRP